MNKIETMAHVLAEAIVFVKRINLLIFSKEAIFKTVIALNAYCQYGG